MKEISEILLDINAVSIKPDFSFTWASGIKSPVYCDNRLLLSYPDKRKLVVDAFIRKIKSEYSDIDVVAGTATAGIPHAAFIAQALHLPLIYVRAKPKEHGKQNLIEGHLPSSSKVLVIEDLISTGKSSLQVVEAIRKEGSKVLGVLSIFSYNLKSAEDAFSKADCKYNSLTNFSDLLEVAKNKKLIADEDRERIISWSRGI